MRNGHLPNGRVTTFSGKGEIAHPEVVNILTKINYCVFMSHMQGVCLTVKMYRLEIMLKVIYHEGVQISFSDMVS